MRLDGEGYAWLPLDWVDSERVQRPGAPIKAYDSMTTYYPFSRPLRWEVEGEAHDSLGQPKPKVATVESIPMGMR